jgi:acyl-coenzyme A synthetase/AMP-(fatty) acid ligase
MTIISAILNNIEKYPDRTAIIAEDASFTYHELGEYINLFASYLKQNGLKKEDCVVFQGIQNSAFVIICLGTLLAGGVSVPVEKNILRKNLDNIIHATKAKFVFTKEELPDFSLKGILALCEGVSKIVLSLPEADDVSDILFTTGTTGTPEGIIHTHRSHYATVENILGLIKMSENNITLLTAAMSHSFSIRRFYANMVHGSTVVILFDLLPISRFFEMIERHSVSSIAMNPSLLAMILKVTGEHMSKYKEQLDYIEVSSSPLKKEDLEEAVRLLPCTKIYNIYGSTEAGCTSGFDNALHIDKKACIGKPNCMAEFFLLNEGNIVTEIGPDNTGFLAVKGPIIMKGYLGKPAETEKVLKDGYYLTQDIMHRDEEGFYYFVGRASDIISIGGFKVAPDEVEDAARKYAGIKDCGCVGKANALSGEVPVLFVVPDTGYAEKELKEQLQHNLEGYKLPKEIIIVDEIPRTFNGKILRRKLKERLI